MSPIATISLTAALAIADAATLREAGNAAGLLMGSQFKYDSIFNSSVSVADNIYRTTHSQQYALSTVGNKCKWGATHSNHGQYSLDHCIDSFKYAIAAGQEFRGHNLCWGNDNPSWLENGAFGSDDLRNILQDHITQVMQGIKTAAGRSPLAWDVVNEAVTDSGSDIFKDNIWYSSVPDYIDVAFTAARLADADTLLFYNDYNSDAAGKQKSDRVFEIVKDLVDRKIPIDGVGIQMHLRVDNPPDAEAVAANIDRIGALGLQVHITELDVKCADPCTDTLLQAQAAIYASMLRVCLERKNICTSFETWGFTDAVSWLNGDRCQPVKGPCHPLPFNENYQPKAAAEAMLLVLQGAPIRTYEQLTQTCVNAQALGGLHNVSSVVECQGLCDAKEHCVAMDTNGEKCYLKSYCEGGVGSCSGWCAYRVKPSGDDVSV